jgi:DNA-binding transcriptional MerR regulator
MENVNYTLKELCQAANVTERTVRFYIKEGLLPPPSGAKAFSRYGYEHLLRLQAIRMLKERFLPLGEIKKMLDGKAVPELKMLAEQVGAVPPLGQSHEGENMLTLDKPLDTADVKEVKEVKKVREMKELPFIPSNQPFNPYPPFSGGGYPNVTSPQQSLNRFQGFGTRSFEPQTFVNRPPIFEPAPEYSSEPQKWERINVVPGVELHVESQIAEENRPKFTELIKEMKRLLESGQ